MSKSRDIADSAATINYIDGLDSDAQGQLNDKATLDGSPTFTGTVTATAFSGDGSGLTGVDSLPSQTGNADKYLTTDGSTASWVEIGGSTLDFVASGTLSSGQAVALNSDGTISSISGTQESMGAENTAYASLVDTHVKSAYDSVNNKVVIIFNDGYNGYLKAVVGTISGTTMSFGTVVTVSSVNTLVNDGPSIAYDINAGKMVVTYAFSSGESGRARVGTVSGTSISFGTEYTIESSSVIRQAMVYDENAGKVVFVYDYGGNFSGKVGTVSGTTISFGSRTQFKSGQAHNKAIVYDSNSQKVVVSYRDVSNSNRGTGVVLTVSGTTVSSGTPTVFETAGISLNTASFASGINKIINPYRTDGTNTGKYVIGTVSGTSISYSSGVQFLDATVYAIMSGYNPEANEVVIFYSQGSGGQGNYVTATENSSALDFSPAKPFATVLGSTSQAPATYASASKQLVLAYSLGSSGNTVVYTSDVTTAKSFIGVTNAAISNGATGTVTIKGGKSTSVTGLTTGTPYYINTVDGSITSSASAFPLGLALSSTSILLSNG